MYSAFVPLLCGPPVMTIACVTVAYVTCFASAMRSHAHKKSTKVIFRSPLGFTF